MADPTALIYPEEEVQAMLDGLRDDDPNARSRTLRTIRETPQGMGPRVLAEIEKLLGDRAGCIISIPYEYAEVRWLAAHALAEMRHAEGIQSAVSLQVTLPLTSEDLLTLMEQRGINQSGDRVTKFNELNQMGLLPQCLLTLNGTLSGSDMYKRL